MNTVSSSSLIRRIGFGCLFVGCVVALGVQFARLQQQKGETERLRAQLQETQQEIEELRGERFRILQASSRPVRDTDKEELLRLRNQAAQLKAATNEAQQLRSHLRQW